MTDGAASGAMASIFLAAEVIGIESNIVWIKGKQHKIVQARSLLCYWATNELGVTQSSLSKRLGVAPSTVNYCVARGRELAEEYYYTLETE